MGLLHLLMVLGLVVGHVIVGKAFLLHVFQTLPLNIFPVFIVPLSLWAHIILFKLLVKLLGISAANTKQSGKELKL